VHRKRWGSAQAAVSRNKHHKLNAAEETGYVLSIDSFRIERNKPDIVVANVCLINYVILELL
jgi:hypothetical protein